MRVEERKGKPYLINGDGTKGTRPIAFGDFIYHSAAALAEEYGKNPKTVYSCATRGGKFQGKPVRLATIEEARELVKKAKEAAKPSKPKRRKPRGGQPVWVSGVCYPTYSAAKKGEHIGSKRLKAMIADGRAKDATLKEYKTYLSSKREANKAKVKTVDPMKESGFGAEDAMIEVTTAGGPFEGAVLPSGAVVVCLPGTDFVMVRSSLSEFPEELVREGVCVMK